MLYFLHGSDTKKTREKARALVASLRAKKPDAGVFVLEGATATKDALAEFAGGRGLFESKYIVRLNGVLETAEEKEIILAMAKELAESDNIFLLVEGALDKKTAGAIGKYAEKAEENTENKKVKKPVFNIFSLSDAFGERDKKKTWVLYRRAVDAGFAPEEIHGTLFWQVKCMLLAKGAKTAAEAGLNPFVFGKSARYAKNFSDEELKKISAQLIALYHDSHRGLVEFEEGLEKFLLERV
ncbi:MAG: hypothetical protein AAB769_01250 [Patescibacteria group bacterium]